MTVCHAHTLTSKKITPTGNCSFVPPVGQKLPPAKLISSCLFIYISHYVARLLGFTLGDRGGIVPTKALFYPRNLLFNRVSLCATQVMLVTISSWKLQILILIIL